MQLVMNELFTMTAEGEKCGMEMYDEAVRNVINIQEDNYKMQLSLLAPKQKTVLQAIAREGRAKGITSSRSGCGRNIEGNEGERWGQGSEEGIYMILPNKLLT